MKKLLSMIMAMMMLAMPVLAMAEDAEWSTYTDPNGNYSFNYPTGWTVLDEESIDKIMETADTMGDEQLSAMVQQYAPQIKQSGMVILITDDMTNNVNIVRQDMGMELDDTMMEMLATMLPSQLEAQMEGIEWLADPSYVDLAEGKALLLQYSYELAGVKIVGVQAYAGVGTVLYAFTLTTAGGDVEAAAEDFGFMLGSAQLK